jgi:hypothetical protein
VLLWRTTGRATMLRAAYHVNQTYGKSPAGVGHPVRNDVMLRTVCSDQSSFLDMMEQYFQQPTEVKLRDARPHLHYQVQYQASLALSSPLVRGVWHMKLRLHLG